MCSNLGPKGARKLPLPATYTARCALCTGHFAQCILHSAKFAPCTLGTADRTPRTMHFPKCAFRTSYTPHTAHSHCYPPSQYTLRAFHKCGGGGFGMTPWCDLVCSWRRLLADRHSLPFPWTLSLHRRWCPSASDHPLTFLFLPALTFPLPSPFPSLGLSLRRPQCPSASPHSFPSLSLDRLCQRSPRTCPVSLLCVESTQRKADVGGGGTENQAVMAKFIRFSLNGPRCCTGMHRHARPP